MANRNSTCHLTIQLQDVTKKFIFLAEKEDDEIAKLIRRANKIFKHVQVRERFETLSLRIQNLKGFQEEIKRSFTLTATKLRRDDDELLLATQEVKFLIGKQEWISERRRVLERWLRILFPLEILYFRRHVQEANRVNIDTAYVTRETQWSSEILVDFENDLQVFVIPSTVTEVMTSMYGFGLAKVKEEEAVTAQFEEALTLASETHRGLTIKNVINGTLGQKKAKLKALLYAIKAIKGINKLDQEFREAREMMIEYIYYIEREILFIAVDLVGLTSGFDQVAQTKFLDSFRLKLGALKQQKGGKVLVVVYRILSFLEGKLKGSVIREENETVAFPETYQVVWDELYKIIIRLMSVLYAISGFSSEHLSRKEVMIGSEEIVYRCDREWRATRAKIDEAMKKA